MTVVICNLCRREVAVGVAHPCRPVPPAPDHVSAPQPDRATLRSLPLLEISRQLTRYAMHHGECARVVGLARARFHREAVRTPCTCGLAAVLDAMTAHDACAQEHAEGPQHG